MTDDKIINGAVCGRANRPFTLNELVTGCHESLIDECELVKELEAEIETLEKTIEHLKVCKYNHYLHELCKGNTPVEITASDPDSVAARKIINGDCIYIDFDFSGCVYNDGRGTYIIVWQD
jgi:hypothetical protein